MLQPSRRLTLILFALSLSALGLFVAGCGDDDEGSGEPEAAEVSSSQAIAEIAEVRVGLARALAAYRAGNAEQASELAGTAYLEHFELVEVPLEEADHELTEELEELIREELRAEIDSGAPVAAVAAIIAEANAGLTKAERALSAGDGAAAGSAGNGGGAY